MKNIQLILLLIVSVSTSGYSQTSDNLYDSENKRDKSSILLDTNYKYLKKINNQIIYEKIYNLDSLNASQIETILVSNIPNITDVSDFQKGTNLITFSIKGVYIDIKKYGLSRWNMNGCLAFPMSSNVSIVWKDGKYKITVSNITFNVVSFGVQKLSNHLLRNDGTFDERKAQTSFGHCVEDYLTDKFTINTNISNW